MNILVENLSATSTSHVGEWMSLLNTRGLWPSIWQPVQDENSIRVGLLLVGHVMSQKAPEASSNDDVQSIEALWSVKMALTSNSVVCEMMEDLWNELPAMACLITGSTLQHMAVHLRDIHPNVVNPGFKNFLQMKQANLSIQQASPDGQVSLSEKAVNDAAYQFAELVNEVKHLDLDAGHWHELWEEGEAIGLAIILHYIKHEKRSRLEQLGRIRNVNACINSNIRKLRGALAAFPELVLELVGLWNKREDIAKHIDGDTLRELATDLRGNTARVRQCFEHLCRKLPERWGDEAGRAQKPTAYLYICVHNFIQSSDHRTMQTLHLHSNPALQYLTTTVPSQQNSPRVSSQTMHPFSYHAPASQMSMSAQMDFSGTLRQHELLQPYILQQSFNPVPSVPQSQPQSFYAPQNLGTPQQPRCMPQQPAPQASAPHHLSHQAGGQHDFRVRPNSVQSQCTTQTTISSHPQSLGACNSRPQSVMSDSTGSHSALPESPVSSAVSQDKQAALPAESRDWSIPAAASKDLNNQVMWQPVGPGEGARCGVQDNNMYDKVNSWLAWGGVWQNMPGTGAAMAPMNNVLV